MAFIINPQSVSYEQAKQDIMAYLQTKPDYEKWQDFFASSVGTTVVELLAGLTSLIGFNVIVARKEAYLQYNDNRSSAIGIAQNLNYSVARGLNARIKVTITPTASISISKYSVIGSVSDQDVIILEDVVFNAGVQTSFIATLGELKEEILSIPSSQIANFRFENPDVSDDMRLFLNATEIAYSKYILDLRDDKYVVVSNALGAVDVFYLNKAAPQYVTGDELKISYIALKNLEFETSDVQLNYGTVDLIEMDSVYTSPESVDAIKVNAPLYHETQNVIRGREDYRKQLKTFDSTLIDTNSRDYSSAMVECTYLREDLSLFNATKLAELTERLLSVRVFGVQPTFITHPVRSELKLKITINLLQSTSENILDFVTSIVEEYANILEKEVDLDMIENEIEQASYVKTARVEIDYDDWSATTAKTDKEFVVPTVYNDFIYELKSHVRLTDSVEPTWPEVEGATVVDNELVWECIYDERCNIDKWYADTNFNVNDVIAPIGQLFKYRVKARINLSNSSEPTWTTELGDIIDDNQLRWQCIAIEGTPATWLASNNYATGSVVIPTTPNGKAYVVIGYISTTGATEPTWPETEGDTIVDGSIEWIAREDSNSKVQADWNSYFVIFKQVTIK